MKTLYILIGSFLILSCGSSKDLDATSNETLNEWIHSKQYHIESTYALPFNSTAVSAVLNSTVLGPGINSSQISLIGNPNYLKIDGDSIHADLPYFGERRMGGAYNSRETGVTVDGLLNDYSVETKKGMYIIKFSARDTQGIENYNFILNLSPSLNASISVQSTQRTTIQYRGRVEALEPESEND